MFKPAAMRKNFTEGPIFLKIITFALPIMLTSILQVAYNMADHIVVGQFSGDALALAAVGCTSSLTALVINLLVGISAGTGVVVAQAYGAKNDALVSRAVHTSITFAALGGIIFTAIGIAVSRPALILMGTKPELIDSATTYMRIICAGIPASAVYNFSAAAVRSVGDSKTPLMILSTAGIINVMFNLLFVTVFNMSVDGVALATIISQYISAAWILIVLYRRRGECYALNPKKLGIDKKVLGRILRFGVPAGIQTSLYSISNILMTSAANVFTTVDLSAKTIMGNVDAIVYNTLNSYLHASMTVTAQNYGAGKYKRINKALGYSLLQVATIGILLGQVLLALDYPIMSMFIDATDPNKELILQKGHDLLMIMMNTYFLCGIMETLSGTLRGLGYSILTMSLSVGGICGMRILWIFVFFPMEALHTMPGLFLVYPISWAITGIAMGITCIFAWKKLRRLSSGDGENASLLGISG